MVGYSCVLLDNTVLDATEKHLRTKTNHPPSDYLRGKEEKAESENKIFYYSYFFRNKNNSLK